VTANPELGCSETAAGIATNRYDVGTDELAPDIVGFGCTERPADARHEPDYRVAQRRSLLAAFALNPVALRVADFLQAVD
jgi:hypothetical protein